MMASNIATAETGGQPEQQPVDDWWLPRWSSWLATIGAVVLAFFAILAIAFNFITLSIVNVFAGACQLVAAAVILAIEGSSVVSFLTFAKPIGMFFEGRPLYIRTAVYGGITIFPMLLGPSGAAVMMAFLVSAAITCMYGVILIGRKGKLNETANAAAWS